MPQTWHAVVPAFVAFLQTGSESEQAQIAFSLCTFYDDGGADRGAACCLLANLASHSPANWQAIMDAGGVAILASCLATAASQTCKQRLRPR